RHNDEVTCILPIGAPLDFGKRSLRSVNSGPIFSGGAVPAPYSLKLEDDDRAAGRAAKRISVVPKDALRYGYQLWIDEASGLLLRSTLVTPSGQVLEEIAYTNITVPATISDAQLEASIGGPGYKQFSSRLDDAPHDLSSASGWSVKWLPTGFEMRERVAPPPAEGGVAAVHLVFSDGLASVSVFIERLEPAGERLEGHSMLGAVSAFGTMIGEHQITVVGEVPPVTVERMGRSVVAGD
ncbi:MAG: hypothetical protein HOI95_19525, partial [Chromatiales bacterium]|nr:hypothetical protein [Chromatiales bacterium]